MTRRRLLKSLVVASGAFLLNTWSDVQGQNDQGCESHLSSKTVRWIIPGPPGGGYDMYSRLIKPFYEEALKVQVVIDNVPGAGGLIGAKILQEANPDGLTVGILNVPGLLVAPWPGRRMLPIRRKISRSLAGLPVASKSGPPVAAPAYGPLKTFSRQRKRDL